MISRYQAGFILVVILLFLVGCSGGGHDTPVDPSTYGGPDGSPGLTSAHEGEGSASNHIMLGYWDVALNSGTGEFETVLLRQAVFHINVIQHMQDVANLFIEMLYENYDTGEFHMDVTLTHPFPNTDLRGFDVRGIVFGTGPDILSSKDDPDLMWLSPDGFRLLNEDGWTRWWNPNEFKTPGLFGYTDGKFGTQNGDFPTTLNPYKYFASALGATDPVVPLVDASNRGTFATDEGPATRRYEMRFPLLGGFPDARFQYAIDASWAPPTGGGSIPGIDDFPPEANCPEAFFVGIDSSDSHAYYHEGSGFSGGEFNLDIEVFDWGAMGNPSGVLNEVGAIWIESPTLFDELINVPLNLQPGSSELSGSYKISIPNIHPTGFQGQEVLVHILSGGMESYEPPVPGFTYPIGANLASYILATMPVEIFDPQISGMFDSSGMADDVETIANLCHVIDSIDGLVFVNVTDPSDPFELNNVPLPGSPVAFDVSEGYAYIIDNAASVVRIVDTSPVSDANLLGNTVPTTGTPTSIDVEGNYAYVGCQSGDLDIIDISTPSLAFVANTVTASGAISDVSASGGYAYVATTNLEIFDVDPPGSASLANTVTTSSNVRAVDISDDGYAFIGDSSDQLLVVDVDPVGSAAIVETVGFGDLVNDVECDGELVYMTITNIGLQVIYFDSATSTAYLIGDEPLTTPDELSIDGNMGYSTNGNEIDIVELWEEEEPTGWARTWGGILADEGISVAVDSSGSVYVTGHFESTVDFDPGPGVDNHTSNGDKDIFLSKFDSSGNFEWARTWGGTYSEEGYYGYGVAVDSSGSVYVAGEFQLTVDFDPGPGVDNHTSNGSFDVSLSKFDSSGNFEWARTWGGSWMDEANSVAVDSSGSIYVTGSFRDTADFDPGPGVDNHLSNGITDAFLSKFDSSGSYQWARTWGGTEGDSAKGVAVDSSGSIYVTGSFRDTADFDPGPGVDNYTSDDLNDVFLSKFDSSGSYQWARTWGAGFHDHGKSVAVDSSGGVYVTGDFELGFDFDPGPGVDNHTSNGDRDVFLSKFDSSGSYQWAHTWGGTSSDYGESVAADSYGSLYVSGYFYETADFDPGPGVDNHTSNGNEDIFLSRFDFSGGFEWARTWGATDTDIGHSVAVDSYGSAYITGYFHDMVDFYPGAETD